ncbi:hypothetical protein GGR50DRAFT_266551 [Xylaria sp. CBS 124048]|nr:hypothetical protein GGR50DRAFT_266551 [Xylaria sp. CBS 124048]
MRLASRALRDVQLKRPVARLQISLLLLYWRPGANGTRRLAGKASCHIRALSTFSSHVSVSDYDLILPESTHAFGASVGTRANDASQSSAGGPFVLETSIFHRWGHLLADPTRLAIESDFFQQGAAKDYRPMLLVDRIENAGDFALWNCLLDYQVRVNGPKGAVNVWAGFWGRKTLHDVESPLARAFWRVMLEGVLASNDLSPLKSVWLYSEWMYSFHRVKWPQLYSTVIKHFLRTHQHQRVLQWHLLLAPTFYPGSVEFANILKEFALDQELYEPDTIRSLYLVNRERNLYNVMIPYLFNFGASKLARKWRMICIICGERPRAPAPLRPFLRFLQVYHPEEKLTKSELAAVEYTPEPRYTPEPEEPGELAELKKPEYFRAYMNSVLGETFGIPVKNFNDSLGAQWLATSWVSLDTAIPTISALGITKIGPLSFQSIALRAGNSDELLSRVAQLRENGISAGESSYVQVILYLAEQKDDELLQDLLNSDVHPDVFDDVTLQTQLIHTASDQLGWRTVRLLMVTQLVLAKQSARETANRVLGYYFQSRNQDGVIRILRDMRTYHVPLDYNEAKYIFDSLIIDYNVEKRSLSPQTAAYYLTIFRQLKLVDVPVPVSHWRLIAINMARQGRLDELGKLCMELVDMFLTSNSLRPGFVPVHTDDLLPALKDPLGGVQNLLGAYIPQDALTESSYHPLRDFFNGKLLTAIVENAFVPHPGYGYYAPQGITSRRGGSLAAQIANIIDLLRRLSDQVTWFSVRKLQFLLETCLVSIYGPRLSNMPIRQLMRAKNTLTLGEMKDLIDEAWGSPLMVELDELREIMQTANPDASLDTRVFGSKRQKRAAEAERRRREQREAYRWE